ncbi:unnamed protein product [Heligmosomoides polygyrus]|uniref:Vacuolar protein sorting-associated protein 28 homolog n=1 Tax=Heligmosomoides polygyrus TaxID=6339 RepID=A0A183FSV8_HELPZ|nr:unnamed protein product [Heligmosomoides polygyrus]
MDAREMVEVAKMSAMSMKNNIIGMIPLLESIAEPFQAAGLHPRSSPEDVYPEIVVKDFLRSLKEYVQSEVSIPKEYHRKSTRPPIDRVRGAISKQKGSTRWTNRRGHNIMPMMMAPPFPNMLPQFQCFPCHPR